MKWTIVGTGPISDLFAASLVDNHQEIVGVVSRSVENGIIFSKKWNIKNVYKSISEDKISDVIYIATPNSTHYKYGLEGILNNKHLFIEKPLTHSYLKTKELFELAKSRNLKLMEGYAHITQDFFLEDFEVKEQIKLNYKQKSSKIKNNTYQNASSFSKELFGGVVSDLGVYPLAISVLLNGNVSEIIIEETNFLNDVICELKFKLIHENGKISYIEISKLEDGDNGLYIDSKLVLKHINFQNIPNRMDKEVKIFTRLNDEELLKFEKISLSVAKLVEKIHEIVYK